MNKKTPNTIFCLLIGAEIDQKWAFAAERKLGY